MWKLKVIRSTQRPDTNKTVSHHRRQSESTWSSSVTYRTLLCVRGETKILLRKLWRDWKEEQDIKEAEWVSKKFRSTTAKKCLRSWKESERKKPRVITKSSCDIQKHRERQKNRPKLKVTETLEEAKRKIRTLRDDRKSDEVSGSSESARALDEALGKVGKSWEIYVEDAATFKDDYWKADSDTEESEREI